MSTINPQNASEWGTFFAGFVSVVGLIWATVWAVFKYMLYKVTYPIFLTIKQADSTYVKKSEPDGTRIYWHAEDGKRLESKVDQLLEMASQRRKGDLP